MENLAAVPLRAPTRGGRSVTILVANDILNRFDEEEKYEHGIVRGLISDLVKRDEYGYNKYGQNLETHDGRPTIWDLYQEIIDALQYMRKLLEEGTSDVGNAPMACIYPTLLEMAYTIREEISRQEAVEWEVPDEAKNSQPSCGD